MQYVRTQIYLEPDQHRRLKEEAHRRGVSLAKLLRELVDESLGQSRPRGDLSSLIGLFSSEGGDVSRQKDEWVDQAVREEYERECRPFS